MRRCCSRLQFWGIPRRVSPVDTSVWDIESWRCRGAHRGPAVRRSVASVEGIVMSASGPVQCLRGKVCLHREVGGIGPGVDMGGCQGSTWGPWGAMEGSSTTRLRTRPPSGPSPSHPSRASHFGAALGVWTLGMNPVELVSGCCCSWVSRFRGDP